MRQCILHRATFAVALIAGAMAALASAPAALADSNHSSNWSGYAAHRSGVRFSKVAGSWVQPSAICTPGARSFSAFWVGLGGYSRTATALEQIGTEVDCAASGAVKSTAWYELVPALSRPIHLDIRPGDRIDATVTVRGSRVAVTMHDATTRRWFRKTVTAAVVDIASAEWIAEAPSVCIDATTCQTLPLADFGSATFTLARAQTIAGHAGPIADRTWGRTRISLMPGGTRLIPAEQSSSSGGESTPSRLHAEGSAFTVTYSRATLVSARGRPLSPISYSNHTRL